MGKLTVRGIAAAKGKDKPYKLMDGDGLQLRVATDGGKTWLVRYFIDRKERQYRLPKAYGEAGGAGYCSLHDARQEAARIQTLARQGIDIQIKLQEDAEAAARRRIEEAQVKLVHTQQQLTLNDMFLAWLADGVRRKDGNTELRRSFSVDVLPTIGAVPVKDVTEHHLRGVLRTMVERDANRAAVIMRNDLAQMLAWASKRQPWRKLLVEGNPMDLIEIAKIVAPGFDLQKVRERTLSEAEIRELHQVFVRRQAEYDAAPNKRIVPQPVESTTRCAIWIMLSTLTRVDETTMAKWRHVDFANAEWFIPKANVKDAVSDLTVYLSAFSLAQFKRLQDLTGDSEWCFPARDGKSHLDVKTMTKQITSRQAMFRLDTDGLPGAPLSKQAYDNSLVLAGGINGKWTSHDLRRTGATMMQRLGVHLDVIDRCQNHVLEGSRVRRSYFHYDYADEKRRAWEILGALIFRLLATEP